MGEEAVHSEVVALAAVWVRGWGRFIFPKAGIVGISFSDCSPKSELCHARRRNFSGSHEEG